ncbi:hypothetical protein BDA99DRAFT_556145 [Phascolomyces articulosus]|uniref:Uncharacterized protein n=1 Tax=Phascolomyces articulosus TaxID=60185 RepID=A0AAD5PHW6_9FUNG|nr:hypothetical protein BDA99DRAFT_556145 [Phascolomyces articulosus]
MNNNNNKRSAPHVIFLVNSSEPNVDTIQQLILNILLYFLDCIDKRTTWGYRFFHGGSLHGDATATPFISTTANQPFRPISMQAMETFKQDFLKQQQRQVHEEESIDANDDKCHSTATFSSCTFEIIKRTLIQSIAEFHWSDADLASESPRRRHSSRKPTQVDVKNFIYLLTPLPQTVSQWNDFMISSQKVDKDENEGNDVIAKRLRIVHAELRRWLWDDYIENRISLSWIDTLNFISDNEQEAKSIYHGINTVLRPFGGGYTQISKLTADDHSYGNSFASMFHSLNARTIKVVPEDMALPRTDKTLLGYGATPLHHYPAELIFTPQIAPIQIEMYPVNQSNDNDQQVSEKIKQIDVLCAIYRHQINIRSLDTDIPQLFLLVSKHNEKESYSNDFYIFIQQLKNRGAAAVVRYGDRFGVIEPKTTYSVLLRLLVTQFKMFDIEPEQQELLMGRPFDMIGFNALEFLDIPATTVKKEKISTFFKEPSSSGQQHSKEQLKLGSLSSEQTNILQAMKERRRQRKEKLAKTKEKKEYRTPVASQENQEEKAVFQLPTTIETLVQSLQELYYGTLYTQKWMLGEGMKLIYKSINNILSTSNSILPELITVVKSMTILSSEFDSKHRDLIPTLMDASSDLSKIPKEEERTYFVAWKNSVIRLQSREIYELELKARNALKTREGRLQMAILVLLIWLERRAGKRSKSMKTMKSIDHHPVDLDDPDTENQLDIYYTRVTIWENVYDVAKYLYELNSLDIKEHKLDPSDISSSAFCTCMNQCFSRVVPDWTKRLVDQCTEGDLMYNTEASLSQTPSLPDSQTSTQRSTQPSTQPSSSQQQQQQKQKQRQQQQQKRHKKRERAPDRIPSSQPKKARKSDLMDLPFMRREVDLSVRKRPEVTRQAEEATMARIQRSAVNGVPTMKRVGSFIKSAMSPRRSKPEKHEEEEDRVLKVRQPSSPTTPRTRFERDFGFLLSGFGYTPHRHGDGDTTPHRPRRGSLLSIDPNDTSPGRRGKELDLDDDLDLDDEGMARTPRRVRQLMMDTTPSGRYAKMRNTHTPYRRTAPRSNFTEALLATLSTSAPTKPLDDDDDLADFHLSDESEDDGEEGGMDLTKFMNFNTNPLRLDSDEEEEIQNEEEDVDDDEEEDDNPYLYK